MDLELSDKAKDFLGVAATLGSGFLAWLYTSTKKYEKFFPKPGSYTLKLRLEDAVANTFGKAIKDKIFNDTYGGADLRPNVMGWLNKTFGAGIGLLILDWVLENVVDEAYTKDLDGLRNIIKGVGYGLTIGGAVGGIFDPNGEVAQAEQAQTQTESASTAQSGGSAEHFATLAAQLNRQIAAGGGY